MKLIIGNKRYSSWSLRPWLLMKQAGIPFYEILIRIHRQDSLEKIRRFSPGGRVPALIDGKITVWESLAVCEYIAEKFPKKKLWPKKPADRAYARSIANEMHAGFSDLRKNLPMDCCLRTRFKKMDASVRNDIARIQEIWITALEKSSGPFLFGDFSVADAMFAPVCMRFESYGIKLDPICEAYKAAILALPAMQAWVYDALEEKDLGE